MYIVVFLEDVHSIYPRYRGAILPNLGRAK